MTEPMQPFSVDDPVFIAELRSGKDHAFEQLVRHQGGRMLAVAMRLLHKEDDARDCVQDAFLQALKNIGRFEERSQLSTWLHRIVVNAALMKIRTRQRHPESALDDLLPQFNRFGGRVGNEPKSDLPSVAETTERKEVRDWVQTNIGKLPEIYRTVLVLRDIEEYDTDTVAQMLEATPGTVKTRLHRARALLKRLMEQSMKTKGD